MAAVRMTMYFGQAQTGWSETLWYQPGINTQFWTKMQAMCQKRVDMLQANHNLLAVRVTEEGANRQTRLILAGGPTQIDSSGLTVRIASRGGENGTGTNAEGPPDQVRAAMHLEVIKDGKRLGLRYLAGIPDKISLTENPTLGKDVQTVWWNLFDLYRQAFINDGWSIKALDKSTAFPLIEVVSYRLRAAAPSVLGLVIPLAQPWTHGVGMKVALQGVKMTRKGLKSPNGPHIIDAQETDTPNGTRTVWLRRTEDFDPSTFLTLGKVRAVSYAYVQPTWIEPIRVGIHKRGKPFGSPVGRRPIR